VGRVRRRALRRRTLHRHLAEPGGKPPCRPELRH
jgi:hypothetical protein